MTRIRCVVERTTYQNLDNGYSILKVRVKGYNELVPLVGNLFDTTVGSVFLVEGSWKVDVKYGRQFMAEKCEETMPATLHGIEKYLGSGLVKGVGPKCAKQIVSVFGLDTIGVIEGSPDRLLTVPSIVKNRVGMIKESWERQKEVKNIMLFLQGHGLAPDSPQKSIKPMGMRVSGRSKITCFVLRTIFEEFGSKSRTQLRKNWDLERNPLSGAEAALCIR